MHDLTNLITGRRGNSSGQIAFTLGNVLKTRDYGLQVAGDQASNNRRSDDEKRHGRYNDDQPKSQDLLGVGGRSGNGIGKAVVAGFAKLLQGTGECLLRLVHAQYRWRNRGRIKGSFDHS